MDGRELSSVECSWRKQAVSGGLRRCETEKRGCGLRVAVGSVVFLVAAFVCHVLPVTVCPSLITIYVSQLRETGTGPELRVRSATARPARAAPRRSRSGRAGRESSSGLTLSQSHRLTSLRATLSIL